MTILERIAERKKEEVSELRLDQRSSELRSKALDLPPTRGFRQALQASSHFPSLIAEVKKASPSQGAIRPSFDPATIALSYRNAGADCLSVLTDSDFFQGDSAYLALCREASGLPCLRKDFIIHPSQVWESRVLGADCILLIAAMLSGAQLEEFHGLGKEAGMDVLVEVHDALEAEVVPREADLVGVNNRSLHTFAEDFGNTSRLMKLLAQPDRTLVSESSISKTEQVRRAAESGARSVLIGTAFCRAEDPGHMVKVVMGW